MFTIIKTFNQYVFHNFYLFAFQSIEKMVNMVNVFGHFLLKCCRMIIELLWGLSYRLAFLYIACVKSIHYKCRHTPFINSTYQKLTAQLYWTPLVWNLITKVLHLSSDHMNSWPLEVGFQLLFHSLLSCLEWKPAEESELRRSRQEEAS